MMLSVGDEALSYLRRRADVSDLSAMPQPYQVCRAKAYVAPCLQISACQSLLCFHGVGYF